MRFVRFSLLLFFLYSSAIGEEYFLSICAIFQDEGPYLKEWIDYHKSVGVDHFYLYNNESKDDCLIVLKPYISSGDVELVDWPDIWPEIHFGYGCQPKAYMDCINKCSGKTTWLAIIDLDEYLLPMKKGCLKKTLKKYYPHSAAIYVNWLQFGTGGVNVGPGPILPYLTKCASKDNWWNRLGKTIVRPDVVEGVEDPHFCKIISPFQYFNGDADMVLDHQHHEKYLRINHYTYRDEWYFHNIKIPRYLKWNTSPTELLKKNDEFSEQENYDIFRVLQ